MRMSTRIESRELNSLVHLAIDHHHVTGVTEAVRHAISQVALLLWHIHVIVLCADDGRRVVNLLRVGCLVHLLRILGRVALVYAVQVDQM